MKKSIKILTGLLSIGLIGCVVGCITSCTTNINGTVITTNNNGISITHEQTLSTAGQYKLSTTSSNAPVTKIAKGTNTLNLPSSVAYNSDKSVQCVITLVTENQTFDAISRIQWNSASKTWEVVADGKVVWIVCNESGTTNFLFNLSLVSVPANTFAHTNYYFVVSLQNP